MDFQSASKLASEYARQNLKDYPDAWDKNSEAGVDWFYGLMKSNPNLSIRMPEATSIARATAFNRYNVDMFFDQYKRIIISSLNRIAFGTWTIQGLKLSKALRKFYLRRG